MEQSLESEWSRFSLWAGGFAAGLFAFLLVALFLIDPYDTGRSPLAGEPRLQGQKAIDSVASVGRNPRFTGAVIGNSTIALIKPSRLADLTGIPFAQLSVPGVQVREQLTIIDWFIRHRPETAKALVISINQDTWCTRNPSLPSENPFPYWRFSREPLDYLVGLASLTSLEQAVGLLMPGRSTKAASLDGYWDYEPMYAPLLANPARQRDLLYRRPDDQRAPPGTTFPGADALEAKLKSLPENLTVTLVLPPVFVAKHPKPGTPRHAAEQACRQRYLDLASRRPKTAVVDWWGERPETSRPELFIDQIHYRHALARMIEKEIAESINRLR